MPELFSHYLKNDANLVSYWRENGDSLDSKGSLNLTDTNISYPVGKYNQCAIFNGTSSKQYSSSLVSSSLLGSISFWFKPSALGLNGTFFCSSDEATDNNFWRIAIDSTNFIRVNSEKAGVATTVRTTLSVSTEEWYHFVAASSGTEYKLYLNGRPETVVVVSGSNNGDWMGDISGRDNTVLGLLQRNTSIQYYSGYLEDVSVWERELTANEVKSIYNNYQRGPNYLSSTSENGISVTERYR